MGNESSGLKIFFYVLIAMGAVASGLAGYFFFYRYPIRSTRAFKLSSDSMCPTACIGERVLVRIDPSAPYAPSRGDVIVMAYHHGSNIFIKRVIGVSGDIISPGPDGAIKMNGEIWQPPPVCGVPTETEAKNSAGLAPIQFSETKVPEGSYFVIGDNLIHSLDSRTEEFGLVPAGDVKGKAFLLYYSPQFSRIGCKIQ